MGEFKDIKEGTRFETLEENAFIDKTFPTGSKATFLGFRVRERYDGYYLKFPKFQFDGDEHKSRGLEENFLKKL